jgi:hypothetical protein
MKSPTYYTALQYCSGGLIKNNNNNNNNKLDVIIHSGDNM